MVDAHLPEIYTGTAFNAEPFDPAAVPVWVDLSARYLQTGTANRGQSQYELDQSQTGTADVTWYDQDEALNPGNPSSPYAPNVVPYRPFLWLVMWPNSGTGNLLAGAGYDGSFESYATTAQVLAWLTALTNVAGVSVTVETLVGAGAWQGTKAMSLAISTSTTAVGGVQFTLILIPGRTYTAQVHVSQNVARAFQLAIGNQTIAVDPFTRTTANGWGTPPSVFGFGPAWTTSGGTLANYLTAAEFAYHSQSSVNTRMTTVIAATGANAAVQDCDVWVTVTIPVVATGQAIQASLVARWLSASDSISCLISFSIDNQVTITAQRTTAGTTFSIGSNATIDNYVAGDSFRMHLSSVGPDIRCKGWKVTTPVPEPAPWSVQVSDSTTSVPGKVGVTSILTTGNTNTLPVALAFSDFRAIGSTVDTVNGVTSTSGSYQLLKQTFVASQPLHTIQLETQAVPPGSATVLVDGIQVEPGGTANTFTTAGPIIRPPWTRGYVERWPAQWDPDSNGRLGIMQGPVVGPFFQLASVKLRTELIGATLAKNPRYYWRLTEPQGASSFADSSGYGGPPIIRFDQPIAGPATTFEPGTDTAIPGNPGQTGVKIDGINNTDNDTILQVGNGIGQDLTNVGSNGLSWGVTMSLWMSTTAVSSQLYGGGIAWMFSSPHIIGQSQPLFEIQTQYTLTNQGPLAFFSSAGHGVSTVQPTSTNDYFDGNPHHYVATLNMANDVITVTMYLDGAVYGTPGSATVSATWGTPTIPAVFGGTSLSGILAVGGNSTFPIGSGVFGTYSEFAIFNRALSAAEVADIYQAGQAYPNENSGTRVDRYLTLAGYTGIRDIGQGLTTMGPSTLSDQTYALSAIMDGPVATEFGHFYESQIGVAYRGRQARYLATTSTFTFGDRIDLGEYPYLGDIAYDDDATYVFNQAVITREGGAIVRAADLSGASQMRYASRTFERTVGGNNDNEAQDMATWVVANYKDARPRVASITFDLAATRGLTVDDGTLWPMVLKLEIGTRVTLKQRPKAANGGAGLTMSADFFIEAISPGSISIETGQWLVTLLMSPVPVTGQPWILEDTTYGVLGSTTILGF